MFKTLEEFQAAHPDLEVDIDFAALVVKKKGVIAFKRETMSGTRKFNNAVAAERKANPDSDLVDISLDHMCSCLLTPSAEEFRAWVEDVPAIMAHAPGLVQALARTSIEDSKKVLG